MGLIATDLDNTLYDWVSYYSRSFMAMLDALQTLTGVERERLLDEFKEVHQRHGNSEQPFALLELPSVRALYPEDSRSELAARLDSALHAFNRARRQHLHLYDGVYDTLAELARRGHVIVGHTEAVMVNSFYRLEKLGIRHFFTRLYALEGDCQEHPSPERSRRLEPPPDFVRTIPRAERKPNPAVLRDICRREGFATTEAVFVGDSLSRDITMAKDAGVRAVWARYGTEYDRDLWQVLVRITHWTDADVQREAALNATSRTVEPDATIGSYSELLSIL